MLGSALAGECSVVETMRLLNARFERAYVTGPPSVIKGRVSNCSLLPIDHAEMRIGHRQPADSFR